MRKAHICGSLASPTLNTCRAPGSAWDYSGAFRTDTGKAALDMFPALSVARQTTVVVPIGNLLPDEGSHDHANRRKRRDDDAAGNHKCWRRRITGCEYETLRAGARRASNQDFDVEATTHRVG